MHIITCATDVKVAMHMLKTHNWMNFDDMDGEKFIIYAIFKGYQGSPGQVISTWEGEILNA